MTPENKDQIEAIKPFILKAGDMLLERMDDVGTVAVKRATELVTDLDKNVEDMLLEGFSSLFPHDNFLAEESGAASGTNQRTWYIDPLDGTTNYAHGYPYFSISVACADENGLQLGVVFAPYLDELYLATKGGGAFLERVRNGRKMKLGPRQPVGLSDALLATGFPYVRDETVDLQMNHVGNFLKAQCHGVRRGGSAAVDLVHVAAGKLDGYWEYHLRPWDTAAGTLVAREAGAVVTDVTGKTEPMHYHNILCGAPGLHREMLTMLARENHEPGAGICHD
jgi:myo-inositol-1(or 4)-monophosphatase